MYSERVSALAGVVAWRTIGTGAPVRVLPDGCLDLIRHDGTVLVAGPDTAARLSPAAPGSRWAGLRFAGGVGPLVVGVPADELRDRLVPLDALWPAAEVRRLAEADDPIAALEAAARRRWRDPDRAVTAIARGAGAGRRAAEIATATGLSARHLLRRSRAAFGYGPATLARILRMQRAVAAARAGTPFATVAAVAGYADQAHLSRDVKDLAGVPLTQLL